MTGRLHGVYVKNFGVPHISKFRRGLDKGNKKKEGKQKQHKKLHL